MAGGQSFTKTWRMKNTGTSDWGSGYQIVFTGDDQLGGQSAVSVPSTSHGSEQDISVSMAAPSTAGHSRGNWRLRNPSGVFFGDTVWVDIVVPSLGTPTSGDITVTSTQYPSVVTPGQRFRPSITVRVESGQLRESRGDMLRNTDGNLYGAWPLVAVVGSVSAGQTYTFQFYEANPIVAPATVGTYTSRWRAWRDGTWAGNEITIQFDVRSGGGTRPSAPQLSSPGNWYVSRDGSTPTLCAQPTGSAAQYFLQIYESAQIADSGWIGASCWAPPRLGAYTYQWRVKARDTSGTLESDWSDTWHFSIDEQSISIDDFRFSTSPVYDPDDVRIYTCAHGFGGFLSMKIEANRATDGSSSGEWQMISHDRFCFDPGDPSNWPEWSTLSQGDGTHRIRATVYHDPYVATKETTYTLGRRRPPGPEHPTPEDNTWVNSRTVEVTWQPALRATSYQLFIAAAPPARQNPLLNVTLPTTAQRYAYTFSDSYPDLYAEILAINELGSSGNSWHFGIDTTPPTARVLSLAAKTAESQFTVAWSGSDNASGLRWYNVQQRDSNRPDSAWVDWKTQTTDTSGIFTGQPGHKYYFRAQAMDVATNLGPYAGGDGDTSTTIDLAAGAQSPWWNTAYSAKRNLVILNGDSTSLPSGYPIRVRFDSTTTPQASEIYNASMATDKGGDVRVVYQNQTEIGRYLRVFSANEIETWFDLQAAIGPNPTTDSTSYQIYYGNAAATDPPGTINGVLPPTSDGNTLGLWHFNENSGTTISDSSGHGYSGIPTNVGWAPGKFGPAGVFNGSNSKVDVGSSTVFNTVNLTVEAWIYLPQVVDGEQTVFRKSSNDGSLIYDFLNQRDGLYLRLNGSNGFVKSNQRLTSGRWYHVAGTYDGSNIKVYINGTLDGTQPYSVPLRVGTSTNLYLGGDGQFNSEWFPGLIQHARISNVARSAFPYGQFGTITIETITAAGSAQQPPDTRRPDLAVLDASLFPPNSDGTGQVLQLTLANQGDGATRNGFFADLCTQLTSGACDSAHSTRQWVASAIDAGATIEVTTVLSGTLGTAGVTTKSVGALTETSQTLYAQVDSTSAVADGDRTNNLSPAITYCTVAADPYETDNAAATAKTIMLGAAAQTHNFHLAADQDWVKFTATAGRPYRVATSSLGSAADTYLYLYDRDGTTLLAQNDDSGGSLASQIDWTAPATGTYFVKVTHWNPDGAGCGTNYDVSVNDVGSPTPTPTPVTPTPTNTVTPTATGAPASGTGLLRVYSDPAVATTIKINGVSRNDWGLDWLELPAGSYTLSFSELTGFSTPSTISVKRCNPSCGAAVDQAVSSAITVRAGETTEVRAPFTTLGFLRATTDGSGTDSPTVSIDGYPANEWGIWVAVPTGQSHTISFEDLPGHTRPCSPSLSASAGSTTRVHGSYSSGSCSLVAGGSNAGPSPGASATPTATPTSSAPPTVMPNGTGAASPAVPLSVVAAQTGTPTATGTPMLAPTSGTPPTTTGVAGSPAVPALRPATAGTGLLRVYSDPAAVTTISIDGVRRNDWGLDWLELAPGNYTLAFSGVSGFFTPSTISVKRCNPNCGSATDQAVSSAITVRAGETTEVRAPFTAVGFLRITSEGTGTASPTISIDGNPANEWGAWVALPAGSHSVSFETIGGTTHPCDKTVTLTAGATIHVHGNYASGSCNVV